MPTLDVKIPHDLKTKMKQHDELDWDKLIQGFIRSQLFKIELADSLASKSDLTEEEAAEIGDKIKKEIARRHELVK
ncbi:MAG: hypothetical protein ACOCSJ_04930 [Candidatus Natronoplasma sp.]